MIDQKRIGQADADRVIENPEGHFSDIKRIEISPAKLSCTISAFANTAGGELFVGIGETPDRAHRLWEGFPTMEAANGLFQVISQMTPLANHYEATWLTCEGRHGYVLQLVIPKTRDIVVATDGYPYKRHNAQNLRVSGDDALQRLRLDKGVITFEDDVVNVPLDTVTNSETSLRFLLEAVMNQRQVKRPASA